MRFHDLTFECPLCGASVVANELGTGRRMNATINAAMVREIGPYDRFAYYRGEVACPGCSSRLGVSFRDTIRRYPARTEVDGVRVLREDEASLEE